MHKQKKNVIKIFPRRLIATINVYLGANKYINKYNANKKKIRSLDFPHELL